MNVDAGCRVAVVADRMGWEEKRLFTVGAESGMKIEWVNDESLCLGGRTPESICGFDAVLIRSRSYTRGGLIAGLLEQTVGPDGVPVINSGRAVALCENKLVLRAELGSAGIAVPDFRLVLSRADFRLAMEQLPQPFVLKPVFGGMGRRVVLVRNTDVAQAFYDYIEDLGHAFEQAMLAEPYLGKRSIRCLVVGRELVAAAEFESSGSDWRNNAAIGSDQRALVADPDMRTIVDRVVELLGEGIYGVDLFRTPDGYLVNEVNHAPGFRAVATASGVDVAGAVNHYVRQRLQ